MSSFLTAIKLGFQGYFDFRGKSTPAEFWPWVLFGLLVSAVLTLVVSYLFDWSLGGIGRILILVALVTLGIPGLAVTVRRFNDANKSVWWLLLGLLSWLVIPLTNLVDRDCWEGFFCWQPYVGYFDNVVWLWWVVPLIILVVWLMSPRNDEANRQGPGAEESQPMISFIGAIKLGFQRYFDFSGRSTRAEYWWWVLFAFLSAIALTIVDNILGVNGEDGGGGLITGLWGLVTLIPGLAVTIRRLHDINKSGWWILLALISWLIIPAIVLLIWFIRPSHSEANKQDLGVYVIFGSIIGFIIGIVFAILLPLPSLYELSEHTGWTGYSYTFQTTGVLIHLIIYSAFIFAGSKLGRRAYREMNN
jgi:uncharacterized membrane protein YhaH (DUF805 family)